MIVWRAKAGAPVRVRAWFGANGTGSLQLYERVQVGDPALLASNPSVDERLVFDLQRDSRARLNVTVLAGVPGGADLPVFIEVRQGFDDQHDGAILKADEAGQLLNGDPPDALEQAEAAPFNVPKYYDFEVSFA
jgi:hypothetical protein